MSLVIFDTETGGLTERHPTIQIAAIAVDDDWTEIAAFERKIRFALADAEPEALKLNSYDPTVWAAEAINHRDACQEFGQFLRDHADMERVSTRTGRSYMVTRLCGHNAAGFDLPRVSNEFRSFSIFFPGDFGVLDSLQLYRWLKHIRPQDEHPSSGKLGDIATYYGVSIDGAHDALADCRIVAAVVPKMLAKIGVAPCPR